MDPGGDLQRDTMKNAPHTFKLICAKCRAVITCDESIIDTGGACPKCLTPVDLRAYPPLVGVIERRAADARAEEESKRAAQEAEREAWRAERERERRERDRERAALRRAECEREQEELRRRAEEAEMRRQQLDAAERARERESTAREKRDAEAALEHAVIECFGARSMPDSSSLATGERLLRVLAGVEAVIALLLILAGLVAIAFLSAFAFAAGITLIAYGALSLISAALTWAASGIFLALREVMLNSYRQSVLLQRIALLLGHDRKNDPL